MVFDNQITIDEEAIFTKDCKNPVFIVLLSGSSLFAKGIKKVTNSEWSHAMISFNSKLDPLYSFGTKADGKLGFAINNPKSKEFNIADVKYEVYVMYVTDKAKSIMKKALQVFIDNKDKLKYDFHGIVDIWVGRASDQRQTKWFCSRFVMYLISKATEIGKAPSLWKPSDITKLENISLVNRGFNFYNYDHKVTDRHLKDIRNNKYDKGDVLYESVEGDFRKYLTTGSEYFLCNYYEFNYKGSACKVPEVGFPDSSRADYLSMKTAAITAANNYYKFKPSDANRDYPFKFYTYLTLSPDEINKLIAKNVPLTKRFTANLYQCNFEDKKKRISVVLVASPGTIYTMYLLLQNNTLYRFDYNGSTYQESTIVEESNNENSVVYFTREISPESLLRIYHAMDNQLLGKVGVKISTGEKGGHNFLNPNLIKDLVQELHGTILECNTAYRGSRNTSQVHWETIRYHGFDNIADVDLMDEYGEVSIPVKSGYHLKENFVGNTVDKYNTLLILSHFKGHLMAGFGGALKNMSIGMASAKGKIHIHTHGVGGDMMKADRDKFLESMVDADRSIMDYFGRDNILYINIANNLSVDCDCDPHPSKPLIEDIGIFASTDPVALDRACVDAVYNHHNPKKSSLIKRIESRNGTHILDCAEKKGLGSQSYTIIDIDMNMDESTVYDPISGENIESVFAIEDYEESAKLAQRQIYKLNDVGKLKCINCTALSTNNNSIIYAEYKISDDRDAQELNNFVEYMNKVVETTQYCGEFKKPKRVSKDAIGKLELYVDEGIKSYKNPARQLQIKNTKKKNDQIKKGNYGFTGKPVPSKK